MSTDDYLRRVQGAESPTGATNPQSGAFGHFQFMPATAAGLAGRTTWGAGLTPDQVKTTIAADPGKERQLADLYTADSDKALTGAGLPTSDANRYALHAFGPGGGVSLLQAPATMSTADWVRSVNWGQGVSPDAVIKQNGLDRYGTAGDVRDKFITARLGVPAPPPEAIQPPPATVDMPNGVLPIYNDAKAVMPRPAIDPSAAAALAQVYAQPDPQAARNAEARRTKQRLFG